MKNHSKSNPIIIMRIVFIAYVVITVFLTIFAFRTKKIDMKFNSNNVIEWTDGWKIYTDGNLNDKTTIPCKIEGVSVETIVIKNCLPRDLEGKNCLLIESKRQDTLIYVNNGLRKVITSATLRQGRSLPYEYIMVPLDSMDRGANVAVTLRSDSIYSGNIGRIYLGDQISIIMMLLQKNIIWLLLITVLISIGVLCLIFKFIYRKSFERSNIFAYLGAFCIFTSIYCFNQLRIKQCFVSDLPMLEVIGYCAFMLVPFTLVMIAYGVSSFKHRRTIIILGFVSLLNFIAQQLHHNITNMDYFSMQSITQILILAILVILILIHAMDKDKGEIRDTEFVAMSCTYVLLGIIAEAVLASAEKDIPVGSIYLVSSLLFAFVVLIYCFVSISKENEGKKKAELANQAKSAFLASMSHEIRTPINAIVGINEIISRETKEDHTKKYASNIAEASHTLLYLVNDILDYSKIESGKLDIVDVEYDVKKCLEELRILVEARVQNKNLDFEFDIDETTPSVLYGDIARIKQVCINLLTNAIKYTKEGGFTFKLENRQMSDETTKLFISVKDTGIGIREEDQDKILNSEFIRVDSKKNYNIEGTGLGLSITTKLLKLMNSELKLDSVYGEGSEFYFEIEQKIIDKTPLKDKVENKPENKKKAVAFTCPKAKILVVDDTKMNLTVMKGLLKQYGVKAITCSSGEECIGECETGTFDIIFLDIMMPGLSGEDTLNVLKTEHLIGDTPVVALTANAISGAKEMYMSLGFNEYMTKPFLMSELEEMLRNLLDDELIEEVQNES